MSYMDEYYYLSNLISVFLITAPVSYLFSLEFPTGRASVCSGNSDSCVYSSASSIYSSFCDSYVYYYLNDLVNPTFIIFNSVSLISIFKIWLVEEVYSINVLLDFFFFVVVL